MIFILKKFFNIKASIGCVKFLSLKKIIILSTKSIYNAFKRGSYYPEND